MTTNKRFINDIDNGKLIDTKGELSTIHYSDRVDFYELWEFLNKLNDENEQLKSTIKEVTELLCDEVDLFSDEATEHDINAYIELKELDNKDAFYMATATKKAIKMLKELQE